MEHPLVRAIRNQSHRMPLLDHLDPVPAHDGSLRNATGNPIALTYESNYTPASYEVYPITPSLTQQEFYRNYQQLDTALTDHENIKRWLDERCEALRVHYSRNLVRIDLSKAVYQHIMIMEAFNIWLTMRGRWYMYRPPGYGADGDCGYKMSMPEYVFVIRKSDTESLKAKKRNESRASKKSKKEEKQDDDEEEEEEEAEESLTSLSCVINKVTDAYYDLHDSEKKEISNTLRDRMRDILSRSRFSHITFKDVPNDTIKYDIHGLPKTMRIVNTLCAKDSADALWCHCLFRPNKYIWKEGTTASSNKEYNLSAVAFYCNTTLLSDLRRHCIKTSLSGTQQKGNKRKRGGGGPETETNKDELLNREFFSNHRIVHPSKLRYTYYARNGMVYATRVVPTPNGYTLWDTFSLTESYWSYINYILDNHQLMVANKWHTYYGPSPDFKLVSGPNLCIGENQNNGKHFTVQSKETKQTINYYFKNDQKDYYEDVYLFKFLQADGRPFECQERIDALFLICNTFTEVFINLLSSVERGLPLSMVKESAFRVYKERTSYVEFFFIGSKKKGNRAPHNPLVSWLSCPNDKDLYLACKHFISNHHTREMQDNTALDEVVENEVDSLCKTLTFSPTRTEHYSDMPIQFEVGISSKITTCNSLSQYLSYCRVQLKQNILIPLAKAWYLFNPVVEMPSNQEEGGGTSVQQDSTFAHLRQMVISEVCSNQFRTNINRLIGSKRQLSQSDADLLNCAYQVMRHELPETDTMLTWLNQAIKQHSVAKKEEKDEFRERCKKRIECMMQQRCELIPDILLDICDQMAYKQGRVLGSIHEVRVMIEEILESAVPIGMYRPIAQKFAKTAIHHKDPFINGLADSLKDV